MLRPTLLLPCAFLFAACGTVTNWQEMHTGPMTQADVFDAVASVAQGDGYFEPRRVKAGRRLGDRDGDDRLPELARGGRPDELLELIDREARHRQVPRDGERQGPVRADRHPLVLGGMIEELHLDDVAWLDVVSPRDRLRQGDRRRRDLALRAARREHREPEGEGEGPHAGRALRPGPAATRTMGDVLNRHAGPPTTEALSNERT